MTISNFTLLVLLLCGTSAGTILFWAALDVLGRSRRQTPKGKGGPSQG